jgi:dephospho-CoA kinase
MLRVGLTGGIGCGKSTVAGMMRDLGCRVIDADAIARELAGPGQTAYREIIAAFGKEIVLTNGQLDRTKLAHLVFSDASKLSKLNQILHPRVIAEQERLLVQLERTEPHAIAIVEAPLLIEAGLHKTLKRLIVVWCTREQHIAAQMPLDDKRRMATDEIDNSGSLAATEKQVQNLVAKLKTEI